MSSRFNKVNEYREETSVFYGIDRGEKIPDGYFSDMKNMTSSKYPCLATRSERKSIVYDADIVVPGEPVETVIHSDSVVVACSNGKVMYKDQSIDARGEIRNIISYGNDVYFSPAGVLVDSEGNVSYSHSLIQTVFSVTFCDSASEEINVTVGAKPSAPEGGQYWYDAGNKGLYRYSEATEEWIAVPTMYIKAKVLEGNQSSLNAGDAVRITVGEKEYDSFVSSVFKDSLVFEGVFDSDIISEEIVLTIERRFPVLSYACFFNNRVWGCNYDGNLNEIYASKLGDPLNWYCYRGLSTDSYAVSCGEHGKFTGCSELGDAVVFFKENCIYTIYGTEPSNFQTVKTDCFGVQEGSENSICRINGSLFYKSCHGIMKLSEGSLPVCISQALGADKWSDAVAGTDGRKYYVVMTSLSGEREMFVFDTQYEMWHKEDIPCDSLFAFCNYKNNLLAIGKKSTGESAEPIRKCIKNGPMPDRKKYDDILSYTIDFAKWLAVELMGTLLMQQSFDEIRKTYAENNSMEVSDVSDDVIEYMATYLEIEETSKHIVKMSYVLNEVTCNAYLPVFENVTYKLQDEGRFYWEAKTGIRGFSFSDYKRLKELTVRMKLSSGARCEILVEYDGRREWENIGSFEEDGINTFRIRDRLEKCDTYRLKLQGYGQVVIYSIIETYEEAGNVGF